MEVDPGGVLNRINEIRGSYPPTAVRNFGEGFMEKYLLQTLEYALQDWACHIKTHQGTEVF